MVSTRRSGSLSANNNNNNRSSSTEDKPPSPKRQKGENGGGTTEKSITVSLPAASAENSKELLSAPPVVSDPAECGVTEAPVDADGGGGDVGNDASTSGKADLAAPAVAVVSPIPEGSTPAIVDKPRSSLPTWFNKQSLNFESAPWCKLLSQSAQNPTISMCVSSFSIGSNRQCNFPLKDQSVSGVLCKIKHSQREGGAVAVLEVTGSKGSVQVNGEPVKKGCVCDLHSGDEVVFGLLGNNAYIFQQLMTEVAVKGADIQGNMGGELGSWSLWLSPNPSKRWGELFFLFYTPFWVTLCLGIVVPYKLYESFTEVEYFLLAMISAVPSVLIPLLFVGKTDRKLSFKDRYWVKATVWIMIFSYVGNYFWTHYFFKVLGASYTFPSWRMNDVPHTTFLLAHVCFLFYHVSANMVLRRLRHAIADLPQNLQWAMEAACILLYAYFIAYLETVAISNFPYYEFVDRASMYKVGSLFYAIYFIVSFPMFFRMDEKLGDLWDLPRVAIDALGAAMLVTILLDLWRIFLGPIVPIPETKQCLQSGLPWIQTNANVI